MAQHYVETFDLRRRCALYLTYYRYGDTRKRGMAMLAFKTAYRDAGFIPSEDELPDYLPMVLDFAALTAAGERLLRSHRADLELLRRALAKADSPYGDVVAAVCAQLPRLGRRELGLVLTAWEAGPPREEVGLEPFAPPEYLAGPGGRRERHRRRSCSGGWPCPTWRSACSSSGTSGAGGTTSSAGPAAPPSCRNAACSNGAAPLFHYGTFAAIAGHVIGILIPERWTRAIGIPENAYRWFSAAAGTLAAVLVIGGVVVLAGAACSSPGCGPPPPRSTT